LLLFDGITLSVEVIVSVTTVTCRHCCLSMPVGTLACRCHRFRIAADKLLRGFCCAQEADGDGASRRCVSAGGCAVGMRQAKAAGATNRARRAQTAIEQRREPTKRSISNAVSCVEPSIIAVWAIKLRYNVGAEAVTEGRALRAGAGRAQREQFARVAALKTVDRQVAGGPRQAFGEGQRGGGAGRVRSRRVKAGGGGQVTSSPATVCFQ